MPAFGIGKAKGPKVKFDFKSVAKAAENAIPVNPIESAWDDHALHHLGWVKSKALYGLPPGGVTARWEIGLIQLNGGAVSMWTVPASLGDFIAEALDEGVDPESDEYHEMLGAAHDAIHEVAQQALLEEAEEAVAAGEPVPEPLADGEVPPPIVEFHVSALVDAHKRSSGIGFGRTENELVLVRGVLGEREEVKGATRMLLKVTGQVQSFTDEHGDVHNHTAYTTPSFRDMVQLKFALSTLRTRSRC